MSKKNRPTAESEVETMDCYIILDIVLVLSSHCEELIGGDDSEFEYFSWQEKTIASPVYLH